MVIRRLYALNAALGIFLVADSFLTGISGNMVWRVEDYWEVSKICKSW